MAKDYKNSVHPDVQKPKRPVSTAVVFATGLATGLFAAAIFYLHQQKTQRQQATAPVAQVKAAPAASGAAAVGQSKTGENKTSAAGTAAVGAAADGDKADGAPMPHFDFYTILPRQEVIIPEQEVQAIQQRNRKPADSKTTDSKADGTTSDGKAAAGGAAAADAKKSEGKADGGRGISYMLQAGSFRQRDDADKLRARLALLGVEASVQSVRMEGDETWHRVRVGPNASLRDIDKLRQRMSANNINSILLQIKAESP